MVFIPYLFRFAAYVFFGLAFEIIFSVFGAEKIMGCKIDRRVPHRYLEGFVSLYMVPLYGFGILFLFEPLFSSIIAINWFLRMVIYSAILTMTEAIFGAVLDGFIGFYPWDYYASSKVRMFERGYTLWTLIPLWGIFGYMLEKYVNLMVYLSPCVVQFLRN